MGSSPRGGKESEEAEHTSIHSSVLLLAVTQVLIVIIHNFGLGEGQGLPTPVFWPGEFHGLYSPQGHKESDTTERLTHTHIHIQVHGRGAGEALQTISGYYFKRTSLGFTEAQRLPGGPTRVQSLVQEDPTGTHPS